MSTFSYHRFTLIAGIILATGLPPAVTAQIFFDTQADSKLWLEGSSTVHLFDCIAGTIQGTAYLDEHQGNFEATTAVGANMELDRKNRMQYNGGYDSDELSGSYSRLSSSQQADESLDQENLHILLKIPIKSFDCGRSRMNRDMYKALKSDTFEFITFEFENAEPVREDHPRADSLFTDGYMPFIIEGVLNVAGVDRLVSMIVRGRPNEHGNYRIIGKKKISMKDYDIEPPTALGGLIRAHEDLTVFFDLIVINKKQAHATRDQ